MRVYGIFPDPRPELDLAEPKRFRSCSRLLAWVAMLITGWMIASVGPAAAEPSAAMAPRAERPALPAIDATAPSVLVPMAAPSLSLFERASSRVEQSLAFALSHVGVRYKYGGNTPERGFDCSGLVRWVYNRTWGLMLPRRAKEMAQLGTEVDKTELQPGDLVFFNTLRRTFSHVGIYLGDGQFLHAPSSGGKVRVDNLDENYWQKHWNGARRVVDEELPSLRRPGEPAAR